MPLQRRTDDLDARPWVAFLGRVVGALLLSQSYMTWDLHGRPMHDWDPGTLEKARAFGIDPTVAAQWPSPAGVLAKIAALVLGIAVFWFFLSRLRRWLTARQGASLLCGLVLLAGVMILENGFEGWQRLLPWIPDYLNGAVPVLGGWVRSGAGSAQAPVYVALGVGLCELTLMLAQGQRCLLEAQQGALRARLAPHFLFNALNTLHAQIETDPGTAQATTERLAGLFRQVLAVSEQETVPLHQELAYVEDYLGLERERLGDRLKVRVEVSEAAASLPIPVLGLQVLVENAIRHGVEPRVEGGELRIQADLVGRRLRVAVTDPGQGLGAAKGNGTALANLRARLARPSDLTMGVCDHGFCVAFTYPVR